MEKQASPKIKAKPIQTKTMRRPSVAADRSDPGKGVQTKEKEKVEDDAKKRALWKKNRRQFWSSRLGRVLAAPAVSEKGK